MNKESKAAAAVTRRELLKQYIVLAARDGGLSMTDLDGLFKILSTDLQAVLREFGAQGAGNLLNLGASFLSGLAQRMFGNG